MPATKRKGKGRKHGPVTSALRFGQGLVMGAAGAADDVVGRVVGFNPKSRLDLILDKVIAKKSEVTFDVRDWSEADKEKLEEAVRKRGLDISGDGKFYLVRDLRGIGSNPSKEVSEMTAGEINKELDKLDKLESRNTQAFIDAGRGHERPYDYLDKDDPLSREAKELYDRRRKLRNEMERRYGPGTPSRLPKGFGPIRRNPAVSPEQYRLAQAVLSGTARDTRMSKKVAREIVEKTPKGLRSEFSKNPSAQRYLLFSETMSTTPPDENGTVRGPYTRISHGAAIEVLRKGSPHRFLIHGHFGPTEFWGWTDESNIATERSYKQTHGDLPEGKKNPSLWSRIRHLGEQTTTHKISGAVYSQVGTAKGYKIFRDSRLPQDQQFLVPQIDPQSRFESLTEAKRFIASNPRKPTIYEALVTKLGRLPTNAELKAEVDRIKREAYEEAATKGKLPHQRRGKRNPADTAAEMYESFHGEPSDEVLEFDESEHYHSNLAALGSLIGLKIRTVTGFDMTVEFSDVTLCSNESGTQLYLVGGDQSLDLSKVKLADEKKDSLVIGELWCLGYHTEKDFDKFQPTDYIHCLGEESDYRKLPKDADLWEDAEPPKDDVFGTGTLPSVRYDTMNERIYFDGGTYFINKPLIGTSPGIEG